MRKKRRNRYSDAYCSDRLLRNREHRMQEIEDAIENGEYKILNNEILYAGYSKIECVECRWRMYDRPRAVYNCIDGYGFYCPDCYAWQIAHLRIQKFNEFKKNHFWKYIFRGILFLFLKPLIYILLIAALPISIPLLLLYPKIEVELHDIKIF